MSKEAYKMWAPFGKRWTDWVRPVPFIQTEKNVINDNIVDYSLPNIEYLKECIKDMAIIVDVQGDDSVKEGISLAKLGYRPIPVFNGTNPSRGTLSTANNYLVSILLEWGASKIKNIQLDDDAPPVFLLDSGRLNRYKINRSIFDNSWDVYPQDLPSYKYFFANGITKLLVRGSKINGDLKKLLYKYQRKGMKIFFTDGYLQIKEVKISKTKIEEL